MKSKRIYIFVLIAVSAVLVILGAVYVSKKDSGVNENAIDVNAIDVNAVDVNAVDVNAVDENAEDENAVTRFEWLEILGEQFGIKEYYNNSPYFKDVDSDNPYFCYVQSAVEWDIIETEDTFHGENTATGEFIALTTMRAMGEYKARIYLETDKELGSSDYLNIAYANDFIEKDQLNASFDKEACLAFLDKAQNLNNSILWKDDVTELTRREKVIELEAGNISGYNEETGEVQVDESVLEDLSAGNIIIFEIGNTGLKTAHKIDNIDSTGKLTVSTPSLEEVFDSLIISDVVSFSGDDIVNYYHLSKGHIDPYDSAVSDLRGNSEYMVIPVDTADVGFHDNGFIFSVVSEDNELVLTITDKNTNETEKYPLDDELGDNTQINCSFEITNIDVGTQLIWTREDGLEYVNIQLYAELVEMVNLNAVLEEKEIPLGEFSLPIGYGIASIKMQLYLVVSAEGEISIDARNPIGTNLYYEKGKGIRSIPIEYDYTEPRIDLSAKLNLAVRPKMSLNILQLYEPVEMTVDAGVLAKADTSVHNTQICTDLFITFPLITLGVSVDPIVIEPISKEWEIMTEDNAIYKFNRHYELYQDGTVRYVEECTYAEQNAGQYEEDNTAENAEQDQALSENTQQEVSSTDESLEYEEYTVYKVQKGDTLWQIAIRFYGGGRHCVEIWEENREVIGEDINYILPGQILQLPDLLLQKPDSM